MDAEDVLPSEDAWTDLLKDEDPEEGATTGSEVPAPLPSGDAPPEHPETGLPGERTDGRDERGRFVSKGADADSTGGPAKAGATPSGADATAAPTAKADSTGTDLPATDDETTDLGPIEPLTWRSGNKDHEFPGAVITKHGAVIPPASVEQLKILLGKATTLDEHREQIKQDRLQARYERETHQASVAPIIKEIDHAFTICEALQQARTDQETEQALANLVQWGLGFIQQKPLLMERASLEREKRELAFQRELAQPDPDQQERVLVEQLQGAIDQQIALAKQMPEFTLLSDEDYKDLRTLVLQNPQGFLVQNEQGLHFNGNQFAILVRREAKRAAQMDAVRQEQRKGVEAAKKIAAENALRRNGGKPVVAPPPEPKKPGHGKVPPPRYSRDDFEAQIQRDLEAALAE